MTKKKDLPAMPMYWGDWFKATDLHSLPRDTRCVVFEIMGRMWESNERGYLTINGLPMTDFAKASALGFGQNKTAIKEYLVYELQIITAGIFSKRDSDGAIYSRKILHIIELSDKRAKAGSKGGEKTQANFLANDTANTEDENENEIETVIQYLNSETGKNFKSKTSSTKGLINARLKEGYSVNQIKGVILNKKKQWTGTKFEKFLRPATLFNPSKFETYVNEKQELTLMEKAELKYGNQSE